MSERRFGPKPHGERYLAFVLAVSAAGSVYLGTVQFEFHLPPDPRSRFGMYTLLIAAVLLVGAFAAWRWKRFQAEIVVSDDGVRFWAKGPRRVGATDLPWDHIQRLNFRRITVPKGSDILILVFALSERASRPGREIEFVTNGLEDDLPAVVACIVDTAERNGWRVVGPRVDHVAAWFDGMNWRFEPAEQS